MAPASTYCSLCEAHRDFFEAQLLLRRNAMSIDQDMVDAHGITGAYSSVMSLSTTRSIGPCSNNSAGWLVRPEQSSLVAQKIGHVRVRTPATTTG